MTLPSRLLCLATLSFAFSTHELRAESSAALPTTAEKQAMEKTSAQLERRSDELKVRSAEAVQKSNTLHDQVHASIDERRIAENAKVAETAAKWVATLHVGDPTKEARVASLIATHLGAVRDWHNSHPGKDVPEVDAATGKKRSALERQFIADAAMPKDAHTTLMSGLRAELTPTQAEAVLDCYTEGKVAFTLKGYKAIVPDLTTQEEEVILGFLKTAREEAIDFKGSKLISAVFEIYKTKCEQYLNQNGRNWKQLYKAYTDAIKAKKAAKEASK